MTVLGVLFTLIAVVALVALVQLRSKADTSVQTASVGQEEPSVDSITAVDQSAVDIINGTLVPIEAQTNTVTVTANVSDPNGCEDLSGVSLAISLDEIAGDCMDGGFDAQVECYSSSLTKAELTGCTGAGDTTAIATFTVPVANFAHPTDAGSPQGDLGYHWMIGIMLADAADNRVFDTRTFDVASLAAFSTESVINYGTVGLAQVSDAQTLTFSNTGNRSEDADVVALHTDAPWDPPYPPIDGDMHSDQGANFAIIPAANVHYSLTSDFTYNETPDTGEAAVSKTDAETFAIQLPQQLLDGAGNIPMVDTFWRLKIPDTGVNGEYQNTLVFTAVPTTIAAGGGATPISYNWSETRPAGDTANSWYAVDSDSSGLKLIAAVNAGYGGGTGRLYVTTDGGTNWSETQPVGNVSRSWETVATDASGQDLYAAIYSNFVYASHNGGTSWSQITPPGFGGAGWISIDTDSIGDKVILAATYGRLFVSDDGGATWTQRTPAGAANRAWTDVAVSADGSVLMAAYNGGDVYVSTDGGINWSDKTLSLGTKYWKSLALDGDGINMLASVYAGRVYKSADTGTSWEEVQPAGDANKNWYSVSVNSNGQRMVAVSNYNDVGNDGRVYTSYDGGTNWTVHTPPGAVAQWWLTSAINEVGDRIIVGSDTPLGRLYVATGTSGQ